MIPYMDSNEQTDSDFTRARSRALLRRVSARFRRKLYLEPVALLRRRQKSAPGGEPLVPGDEGRGGGQDRGQRGAVERFRPVLPVLKGERGR